MPESVKGTQMKKSRSACAVLPIRRTHAALGHSLGLFDRLGNETVLTHTLKRLKRVSLVDRIFLAIYADLTDESEQHEFDQRIQAAIDEVDGNEIEMLTADFNAAGLNRDDTLRQRRAARAMTMSAWRGGLGGLNVYDELLPAAPILKLLDQIDPPVQLEAREESERDRDEENLRYRWRYQSLLLAGADWPLVDPELCDEVLERHLQQPEEMQMVFTQCPPGLCGAAVYRGLLKSLADNDTYMGQVMSYIPTKPQPDPIGRDVCVQIPPSVRRMGERLIHDTAISRHWLERLFESPETSAMGASEIAERMLAMKQPESASGELGGSLAGPRETMLYLATKYPVASLPQQVTMELTTRRIAGGALTPQFHIRRAQTPESFRGLAHDMPVDLAKKVIDELAARDDAQLTLGGMGEPLLYPHFENVLMYARSRGIQTIAVETDLISPDALQSEPHPIISRCDHEAFHAPIRSEVEMDVLDRLDQKIPDGEEVHRDTQLLDQLLNWPIDTLLVRMHADRAATYAVTMTDLSTETDRQKELAYAGALFKQLVGHMEYLVNERNRHRRNWLSGLNHAGDGDSGKTGLPWLLPIMIRSPWTYGDIETFFDRWMHYLGQAVLEGLPDVKLMDEQSIWDHYHHLTRTGNGDDKDDHSDPRSLVTPAALPCSMAGGIANTYGRLLVQSDGGVPYCHHDWLGSFVAGNAYELSLQQAWCNVLSYQSTGAPDEIARLCGGCRHFHLTADPWWQDYRGFEKRDDGLKKDKDGVAKEATLVTG